MIVPIIGSSKPNDSITMNEERNVNRYVERDPDGKNEACLLPMPGCRKVYTLGTGPIRSSIEHQGAIHVISGMDIYKIPEFGQERLIGQLNTSAGPVYMATNGTQIGVVDQSQTGWLIQNNEISAISDTDFNGAKQIVFHDGYFIVNQPGTGKFYISGLYSGTSWNALDYATAEVDPDDLLGLLSHREDLWMFGKYTTQLYYNSGDSDFPFTARTGGHMEWGTAAPASAVKLDNQVFWLGSSREGPPQVLRASAFVPTIISTRALDRKIADYGDVSNAFAYGMKWMGHTFYVLTFPKVPATWVYDVESSTWSEWVTYGLGRHLSNAYRFFTNQHYVGDYRNGNIYVLDRDFHLDDTLPIERIRRTRHISNENKNIFWHDLQVDYQPGVGSTTGQGSDPVSMLRISDDGGHTFSEVPSVSMGKIGEYKNRVIFRRLGRSRDRIFEVIDTDPVFSTIVSAYANASRGTA